MAEPARRPLSLRRPYARIREFRGDECVASARSRAGRFRRKLGRRLHRSESGVFFADIRPLVCACIERNTTFVTSEICVAECFYRRLCDAESVSPKTVYDRLIFEESTFDIRPVELETLHWSGASPRRSRPKTDRSRSHFRTALASQCDIFVTNDRRHSAPVKACASVQIAEL